jgi:hypothetical protein
MVLPDLFRGGQASYPNPFGSSDLFPRVDGHERNDHLFKVHTSQASDHPERVTETVLRHDLLAGVDDFPRRLLGRLFV